MTPEMYRLIKFTNGRTHTSRKNKVDISSFLLPSDVSDSYGVFTFGRLGSSKIISIPLLVLFIFVNTANQTLMQTKQANFSGGFGLLPY